MKLGLHVQRWTAGVASMVLETRPPVLKIMEDNPDALGALRDASPRTHLIVRTYFDPGQQEALLRDPDGGWRCADLVAKQFARLTSVWDRDRLWAEGLNEVGLWEDARAYNHFTIGFCEEIRRQGFRPLAYSFPTGNPPGYVDGSPDDLGRYWAHYWDGLWAALECGGGLALHEYSAPRMQDKATWLCLRYRRVYQVLPAGLRALPLMITECGIDGGVIGAPVERAGWRAFTTAEDYAEQLAWYNAELEKDPFVIGATIFTVGNADMWGSFDVTGVEAITRLLATKQEEDDMKNDKRDEFIGYHRAWAALDDAQRAADALEDGALVRAIEVAKDVIRARKGELTLGQSR